MSDLSDTHGRGPLGTRTNRPIIDAGTSPRTQNRPNAPEGAGGNGSLSAQVQNARARAQKALEENLKYYDDPKNLDGSRFTLEQFLRLRDGCVALKAEDAAMSTGLPSMIPYYADGLIERLDQLIARARSPLNQLIARAKEPNSRVTDEELRRGIIDELADAKKRGGGALENVAEAINILAGRKAATLKDLVEKAKKPGSSVTDEQVQQAVRDDIQAEHDAALLGGKSPGTLGVVAEAATVLADRKEAVLKDVVAKAKLPNSPVTDNQLTKAVTDYVDTERTRQLLGGKGGQPLTFLGEAAHVFADRKKAALNGVLQKAKAPGNTVTDAQIKKAVEDVVGAERQCALLGEETGETLSSLLGGAAKVWLDRKKAVVDDLFKRSKVPGSGVTEAQVNKALQDYEDAKDQARRLGVRVPQGDVLDADPQIQKSR